MSWISLTAPSVGTVITDEFLAAVLGNLADLHNRVSLAEGTGVLNGAFENDTDSDSIPDGWVENLAGGGTVALAASPVYEGSQALTVTLPSADTYASVQSGESDTIGEYVPCAYGQRIEAEWAHIASVANIPAKAWLRWFDGTGTQVGADVLIGSTASAPTTWALRRGQAVAPSGAYYYRLKLQGGDTTSAAGTLTFDAVRTRVFHGTVRLDRGSALTPTGTTYTLASGTHHTAGEFPRAALVEYQWAGDAVSPATVTFTLTGNSNDALVAATSTVLLSGQAWVELDEDLTFDVTTSGGTPDTNEIRVVGYEV